MTPTSPTSGPSSRVFILGAHARCADGAAGTVTRVVLDPRTREVTHLVVTRQHHDGFDRLVPLGRVAPAQDDSGDVVLTCTLGELTAFDEAEEHHFLPGGGAFGGYAAGQALAWPYYTARNLGGVGSGGSWNVDDDLGVSMGGAQVMTSTETVPVGEVAVHRGDAVRTTDGSVGHLHGLVLDADDGISHLLLQEGHLWGRKQVAIPIGAVTSMHDGVVLHLSTRQVHDLPEIELLPHPGAT